MNKKRAEEPVAPTEPDERDATIAQLRAEVATKDERLAEAARLIEASKAAVLAAALPGSADGVCANCGHSERRPVPTEPTFVEPASAA